MKCWISGARGLAFNQVSVCVCVCVCVRACVCVSVKYQVQVRGLCSLGIGEIQEKSCYKTPLVSEFRSTYLCDRDPALISKLQITFMPKIYFPFCCEHSSFFFFFFFSSSLLPLLSFLLSHCPLCIDSTNLNWSGIYKSICILNLVLEFWVF